MSGLVAHALLVQEEQANGEMTLWKDTMRARQPFDILDSALNRNASGRDLQGVVRR